MASAPVETKVKAATVAAFGVGVAIALLNWTEANSQLLGSLPSWLQAVVTMAVPPLLTFLSAWQAQHTSRPDMGLLTPVDDQKS